MKLVKISDLADISPSRKKITRNPSDLTPFVPMECVDENIGVIAEVYDEPFEKVSKGYTYFENGDIIFAKITPCMENGKSAIVENLKGGFGFGSTEFIVIRPKKDIYRNLLYQFMRSKDFRDDAKDHFTGSAGQQRVPSSFVKDALIPIPEKDEDIPHIMSLLEEKIARVQAMRQAALKQKEAAEALQSAILRDMFPWQAGDALPDGWRWEKITNISKNLDGKRIPVTEKVRKKGDIPYYGASGIVDYVQDYLFDEDLLLVSEDGANLLMRTYPIAFSISGKTWVNNHAHVLRFQDKDTQKIVEHYINGLDISDYVSGAAQPKLNQENLNRIRIPVPTETNLKSEIVNKIEQAFGFSKRVEKQIDAQLAAIEVLPTAILRESFSFGTQEN